MALHCVVRWFQNVLIVMGLVNVQTPERETCILFKTWNLTTCPRVLVNFSVNKLLSRAFSHAWRTWDAAESSGKKLASGPWVKIWKTALRLCLDLLHTSLQWIPCSHPRYLKSMLEAASTSLCARWGLSPTRMVQSQRWPSFLRAHSCCISWLL